MDAQFLPARYPSTAERLVDRFFHRAAAKAPCVPGLRASQQPSTSHHNQSASRYTRVSKRVSTQPSPCSPCDPTLRGASTRGAEMRDPHNFDAISPADRPPSGPSLLPNRSCLACLSCKLPSMARLVAPPRPIERSSGGSSIIRRRYFIERLRLLQWKDPAASSVDIRLYNSTPEEQRNEQVASTLHPTPLFPLFPEVSIPQIGESNLLV